MKKTANKYFILIRGEYFYDAQLKLKFQITGKSNLYSSVVSANRC